MGEYLIWSNQHSAWWGPNKNGYVRVIEAAGRYSKEDAEAIVRKSTVNGKIKTLYYNSSTDAQEYLYDETMVKAVNFDPKEADPPQEG